jgi:uncharacterized protein (DUF488 family)
VTRELCTIGVYGFDAGRFVESLQHAPVDLVADVRRRRGVRGSQYAFANAKRLVELLRGHDIAYVHLLELAPPRDLLALQHEIDRRGAGLRAREALAPEYVRRYEREVLATADLDDVAARLLPYDRPALLCVETDPATCHRSMVADALAPRLGAPVRHLVPSGAVQ